MFLSNNMLFLFNSYIKTILVKISSPNYLYKYKEIKIINNSEITSELRSVQITMLKHNKVFQYRL